MLSKITGAQVDRPSSGLQQLASRLACILTLVVNIATTVGIFCTIFRLGLHRNPPTIALNQMQQTQEHNNNNHHHHQHYRGPSFTINQDLSADSLVVQDTIRTSSIRSEQISIVGKSPGGLNAEIHLNPDYVSMQASLFGPQLDEPYTFRLASRLKHLEIPHGLSNVRAIRSIVQTTPPTSEHNTNHQGDGQVGADDNLEINGRSPSLELSGNLGLRVHSERIEVSSGESIGLVSREGGIVIHTGDRGRLLLPSLEMIDQEHDDGLFHSREHENKYQLCYHKSDGLVYRTRDSSC